MEHLTQKLSRSFLSSILRKEHECLQSSVKQLPVGKPSNPPCAHTNPPCAHRAELLTQSCRGLGSTLGRWQPALWGVECKQDGCTAPFQGQTHCSHPGREPEDPRKGACSWPSLRKPQELLDWESKHRSPRADRRSSDKAGHQMVFKCLQSVSQDGPCSL